jgi:hypothetical protein
LSDLAKLEEYIAESYNSRSFIELLQNSEDAGSSRMLIKRVGQYIIVANYGRKFTPLDFESICRSGASKKECKTSIGFRGIGFKSVVGFAKRVHIISGELEVTFCRELTAKLIPNAKSVPLIRIPHPIDYNTKSFLLEEIENIFKNNYTTLFIFSDLIADYVEKEFEDFDPTCLLFLKKIKNIILDSSISKVYSTTRKDIDSLSYSVNIIANGNEQSWVIFYENGASIAFQKNGNKYLKIEPKYAVVHAFLPTMEETGFCFKINGNISTDPSRTRIILNENTIAIIHKISDLYIQIINKCLHQIIKYEENLVEVLIPYFDPRLINMQKNTFQKQLILAISNKGKEVLGNFYRYPNWLNLLDGYNICSYAKINIPPRDIAKIDGIDNLSNLP